MRLWHYELIPFLPKQQLLGQWRELNSIYTKENKHILINFIYRYKPIELLAYSQMVLREMQKRGYRFNLDKYYKYFKSKNLDVELIQYEEDSFIIIEPYAYDMDKQYLKICCYNLWEKYIRGQSGFTSEAIEFIKKHL